MQIPDLPTVLEQSDGTAWMARYCLDMLELALSLADEVEQTKVLEPAPGIPVRTTVAYQPLGVVTVIVTEYATAVLAVLATITVNAVPSAEATGNVFEKLATHPEVEYAW